MEAIGIEIDLFVDADENKVRVSFAAMGVSKVDFMALSTKEQGEIVRRYVETMQDQPRWIIDDFSYLTNPHKVNEPK